MPIDSSSTTEPASDNQRDQALIGRLQSRIEKRYKANKSLRDRWATSRKYVGGDEGDDGEKGLVRVNIIKSRLDIIQPAIYAKNPEIAVTPDEHVTPDYALVGKFAKTLEIVLNKLLVKEGKLKKRGKTAVRAALTTTVGWVKAIYQEEFQQDPIVQNRIQDTQDNIARIKMLVDQSKDGNSDGEAALAELEQQLRVLEQQVEVSVSHGLVIDNLLAEDVLILDESINNIDEYANAGAIAHRVWMGADKYNKAFGCGAPKQAKRFGLNKDGDAPQAADSKGDCLYAVWEVWDRDSNTVYTLCEGAKEWCRDPYSPQDLGEQWYPFFPLQFERVDGELHPKSLVEGLIELQDEYNASHTQFKEHREESLPVRVYNKSAGITDGEVKAIANRKANDIVGISGNPDSDINNQMTVLQDPPINPAVYDTEHIMRGFELVSGAQDASAGSVMQAKTATEAEIMSQGSASRTSERLDVIEEWLTDIATYSAQLLLQKLTPAQVQELAGPDAVWPQMSKEQIFRMVEISIRAGSTAKPNKMRERDQWAAFAPQLTQAIIQIAQFRQQGMMDIAEALRKIMDESLKRFDERLSVDMFLPEQQAPMTSGASQGLPSPGIAGQPELAQESGGIADALAALMGGQLLESAPQM